MLKNASPAHAQTTTHISPERPSLARPMVWAPWIAFPFFALQFNTDHPGFLAAVLVIAAVALNISVFARVTILSSPSKPAPLRTAAMAVLIAAAFFVAAGILGHGVRWIASFSSNPVPAPTSRQIDGVSNGLTHLKLVLDGKYCPALISSPKGGGPSESTTGAFRALIEAHSKAQPVGPLLAAVDRHGQQLQRLADEIRVSRNAPEFSWNTNWTGLPANVEFPRFAPILQAVRALSADAIRLAQRGDKAALDRLESAAWLALKASEHGSIIGAAIGVAAQGHVNRTAVTISGRFKDAVRHTYQSPRVAQALADAIAFERAHIARYWVKAGILQRGKLAGSYDGFPKAHDFLFPSLGLAQTAELRQREAQYLEIASIRQSRDRLAAIVEMDSSPHWLRYRELVSFNGTKVAEKGIEMLDSAPSLVKGR